MTRSATGPTAAPGAPEPSGTTRTGVDAAAVRTTVGSHGSSGHPGPADGGGTPRLAGVSLRVRIGALAGLAAAVAVALVSVAAFVTVRMNILETLDDNLLQRATAAANSELSDPIQLAALPTEVFGAGDIRIALVPASGSALSAEGFASAPPFGDPERSVAAGEVAYTARTASLGPAEYRVVAVPAARGLALVMGQRLEPTRQTLARLGLALPIVGGIGVALAAVAGFVAARTGLRPVQQLTAATERVRATGSARPLPVHGHDELAHLTHSFNGMLGALAASREQQRRLVADAGHELRTPLTSLRTNLELLAAVEQEGAPPLPDGERAEILDDVRAQVGELSTLVGDLVELARDDPPQVVHETVDLTEVVERALERVRRRAGDVQFDARVAPWSLPGDATALERAVLNLLDNAAKWSPPGGTVWVQLRPLGDGTVVLEVADSGRGIAEADLPHVFDRFYRADGARTMPGSGLGLAIVKQVAERHGGAVRAGRARGGGALLAVRLPGESWAPVGPTPEGSAAPAVGSVGPGAPPASSGTERTATAVPPGS